MPITPKANAEQLKAKGFSAEQFGKPENFDAFLEPVLVTAAREVRSEIGEDRYEGAAAGSDDRFYIVQAELGLSIAELWRRRKQYSDSAAMNARVSQTTSAYADWEKNAEKAEERAWRYIELLGGGRQRSSHMKSGVTGTSLLEREKV